METDKVEGRPIFVFLHEGMEDTVAGTFGYQGWHGVARSEELKAILAKHPEVVLFSGHSHWVLESDKTFKPVDDTLPAILSTASCAYLWDDNANITNVGINGSQGYYIYVYEDCLVFRGRSFSEGEWISSAQFVMPRVGYVDQPEETEPVTTPETEAVTEVDTPADNAGGDAPTETEAFTATPAETGAQTVGTSDKGCASVLTGAWSVLLPIGAAWGLRRKGKRGAVC